MLQVPTEDTGTAATSYTVKAGDTLGTIARDTLGDPDRYMDIFHASTGLTQDDGATLTDPNLIRVGWTLTIPTTQTHTAPDQDQTDQDQTRPGPPRAAQATGPRARSERPHPSR